MRAPVFVFLLMFATPAFAQSNTQASGNSNMGGMPMSGMSNMPSMGQHPQARTKRHKGRPKSANRRRGEQGLSRSNMSGMPGMGHAAPPNSNPSGQGAAKNNQGMSDRNMSNMPGMSQPQPSSTQAKQKSATNMGNMPGMQMNMTGLFGSYPMGRDASGTSWQPDVVEHHGIHGMLGDWMLMGHLMLYGIYDAQSGPRGDDKFFPSGMIMGMARRDFRDTDTLSLRAMVSPEPFMGARGYPLLLQTGETANGVTPLVDRQHPHDLFMELSGTYVHKFSPDDSGFLYLGYPGEPALGPPAFMHRASGVDNPAAPLTHHWLDSTHIDFGVVTAGFVHDNWKLEVSQFTGREPDQHRFDFDKPQFDSTSARASYNPNQHWSLQASYGHLHSPEQLAPQINEDRYTASAIYATSWAEQSSFAATLAWGLKHLSDGTNLNGVLLEGEYKPCEPWTLFARTEWEQNDEIVANTIADVGELSFGAIRDFKVAEHWKFGLGGQFAFDLTPGRAVPSYGTTPRGGMAFVRIAAQ